MDTQTGTVKASYNSSLREDARMFALPRGAPSSAPVFMPSLIK